MTELSDKQIERYTRLLLTQPFWPNKVDRDAVYARIHDDNDGTRTGHLIVSFNKAGDVMITTDRHHGPELRFRNGFGGSMSNHVYNALLILAEAIRLDNEKIPDGNPYG
jgi:hypothetical protein